MVSPDSPGPAPSGHRDHRFHEVKIGRITRETDEASSFLLDIPEELRPDFGYRPGQFCTFRAVIDGEPHLRCYSMSSSPGLDDGLWVTVKRVPGGVVSNWMIEKLAPGDPIEVTFPAGVFCATEPERELVAFAGGSGITPVFSIIKAVLDESSRRIHLVYANRDLEAVIFREALDKLVERHGERLRITHHFDVERGFIDDAEIEPYVEPATDAEFFICGPGPFMEIVERTLLSHRVPADRIRIERFTPTEAVEPVAEAAAPSASGTKVTIELAGKKAVADYRAGTTVLQTARQLGMSPPFSCEAGSCATCMARLVSGTVKMHANNALTDDELEEGWILTCQSEPTSPEIHVVYE